MPELPDVEGFRQVAEQATECPLVAVQVHDEQVLRGTSPPHLHDALRQRCFTEPRRHGKWLLMPTRRPTERADEEFPYTLLHFGMTGRLLWCSPGTERHEHDRVVFSFDKGELRYQDMRKLSGLHLAEQQSDVDAVMAELGPDAYEVGRTEFTELFTCARRQIKPALMDQSVLAGLGNLCVDEILWRARIHPQRTTTEMSSANWGRLHRRMRSMLRQSIRARQVPDYPSWLTGHRDEPNGTCPRCSARLSRGRTGGRSTVWCPRCQKR